MPKKTLDHITKLGPVAFLFRLNKILAVEFWYHKVIDESYFDPRDGFHVRERGGILIPTRP